MFSKTFDTIWELRYDRTQWVYIRPPTYKHTHVLTNKTRRSDQRWWDISWGITAPLADSKSNLRHCVFILRHRHPFLVFLYSGTFLALPLFYLIKHPLKEAIAQGCHEKDAWSGIMENRRTGERWVFLVLWWRMPLSAEGREMCLGGMRASLGAKSVWRGAGVEELRRSGWHRARQCPSGC